MQPRRRPAVAGVQVANGDRNPWKREETLLHAPRGAKESGAAVHTAGVGWFMGFTAAPVPEPHSGQVFRPARL